VGTGLLAAGNIMIALNRLLFHATRQQIKLSAAVLSISFFISLLVVQSFIYDQSVLSWIIVTSIFSFVITAGLALGYVKKIAWVSSLSPLRKVVIGSTLISAISMPMFYQTYLNQLDRELLQTAREFAQ